MLVAPLDRAVLHRVVGRLQLLPDEGVDVLGDLDPVAPDDPAAVVGGRIQVSTMLVSPPGPAPRFGTLPGGFGGFGRAVDDRGDAALAGGEARRVVAGRVLDGPRVVAGGRVLVGDDDRLALPDGGGEVA